MQEKDILAARDILRNKEHLAELKKVFKGKERILVNVGTITIEVREGALREMLDKEIKYANRKLKTLGATELT